MRQCPFCEEQLLASDTEKCSHCDQSLEEVPLHTYGRPADFLKESLVKVRREQLTPDALNQLYPQLMGAVQHILNKAANDISSNFKSIAQMEEEGIPEEVRKSNSDFIEDFGELQEELNDTLVTISELFGETKTIEDYHANSLAIDQAFEELQGSVDALGMLKNESEIAALAEIPRDPMPDEIGHALEYFERAMEALVRYMEEGQEAEDLSECVQNTDKAKAKLFKLVMMNSMS